MFGTVSTLTSYTKKLRLAGLFLFATTLFSCSNSGEGPCDYHRKEYVKAEVLEIESLGDDSFEVWLEFDRSILGKEKQPLSKLREVTINRTFLELNKIKPGIVYTAYVTELKSGACEPYYLSFEAEFKEE